MNLWGDFDNQHTKAQETVGARQRGRHTEQAMLSLLRSWLLEDYVPSYSHALAAMRFYRRCYWIDAWGMNARLNGQGHSSVSMSPPLAAPTPAISTSTGKGDKKESTQAQVFPPILQSVATLAAQLAQESRPISLYGIALANGSSTRKDGKARLAQAHNSSEGGDDSTSRVENNALTLPKESGIVRASWLEAGPALLQEIDQSPAIFLLNPFGHTLFRFDDLAPLYQRTAPTELCLLLSNKQIEAQLVEASRSTGTAAVLTSLLRTDRWKAFAPKGEETVQSANSLPNVHDIDRVNGLIELLVASMQKHFLPVQLIKLPIQIGPAMLAMVPYTLLFATRSKDSLACMNDAVCLYQRRLARESYHGMLGEEWFVAQQQERDAEALQAMRQRVLQQGRAQRIRRWPDLRQQVLLANFGQWTLHDYDAMITTLISEGLVRCEWRGRRSPNEGAGAGIPGNNDTLLW